MTESGEAPGADQRAREQRRRREAILAVAARAFLARGYAGVSMSAIAAELGGSKGTLWSYFPSKEALFAAVVEAHAAVWRAEVEALLQRHDDLRATLLDFCRGFITCVVSPEAIALRRMIASESGRFPALGRRFNDSAPRKARALLARFLAEQMAAGHLRTDDPARAAEALANLCLARQHDCLWGAPAPDPRGIEAEAGQATDLFLRAFAP